MGRVFKKERIVCAKARRQLDSRGLKMKSGVGLARERVVGKKKAEAGSEEVSISSEDPLRAIALYAFI